MPSVLHPSVPPAFHLPASGRVFMSASASFARLIHGKLLIRIAFLPSDQALVILKRPGHPDDLKISPGFAWRSEFHFRFLRSSRPAGSASAGAREKISALSVPEL